MIPTDISNPSRMSIKSYNFILSLADPKLKKILRESTKPGCIYNNANRGTSSMLKTPIPDWHIILELHT